MEITSYLLGKKSSGGGSDTSEYFYKNVSTGTSTEPIGHWTDCVKKLGDGLVSNDITSCNSLFQGFKGEEISIPSFNPTSVENCANMFYNCLNLKILDLSGFEGNNVTLCRNMFSWCSSIEKIDMRKFNFTNVSTNTGMFLSNMPSNCLIIVKDNEQKEWILYYFNTLTNVKTVEEYEATQ